ncbi:HD domain-containing protein [Bacillus sp. SG-1]|uniref:HD domain-containing protein n=1 Tax=Bacillus sp. SG-1 TaxID=161544 RepID=UPI0001543B9A|nr:HD domain-containing protein [Bacillus sp. SG-1]EDL65887.1 hydrolase (HAD superfamily) protein [Bacillus sp. SG-1]
MMKVMEIIKLGEKLKSELRHSWLSNGRRESVAEHTWRTTLMAVLITPELSVEADMEKLLKMLIIHDLVEAEAGDIPAFDTLDNASFKTAKRNNEIKAIENIRDILNNNTGQELYDLWYEFEEKQTIEAKVANALDKLEAQIQHNESDLSTWINIEHEMSFNLGRHVEFDPVLITLKDIIQNEAEAKLKGAGIDVDVLKDKYQIKS